MQTLLLMGNVDKLSVAVPIINYRLQIAERLGADRDKVLQQANIDPAALLDPTSRIFLPAERALWNSIIAETGREDIGIICGLNFPIQATGLIGYVMMNSPTIGVALQKMCTYQKLIGDSMGMRMEEKEDTVTIFIELWSAWYDELRFTMDILLTACLSWSEKNTVNPIRPIRVGIAYEQPNNYNAYQDAFSPAPVEFGVEESYLVYEKADMDRAILSRDENLFAFFEREVRELYDAFEGTHTTTHKTRKLILEHLEADVPGIEHIAVAMAMSVRALQKALKTEGISYQRLLNEVRKELAIHYLKKGIFNKSEIAFLLGFSELAVFSRNFKKWTGFSPSEYPLSNS